MSAQVSTMKAPRLSPLEDVLHRLVKAEEIGGAGILFLRELRTRVSETVAP